MDTNQNNDLYREIIGQVNTTPEPDKEVATNLDDPYVALRAAQNANRGYWRGPKRPPLAQVNVKCDMELRTLLDDVSLAAGKTKRELLREALAVLKRRYMK